ncbi:glutathione transferase [Aureococcus anophagefferens]|nr:glutathione transferase [Aureococcus anophagefferens]
MTESTAGEFRLLGYGDDYDFLNIAVSGSDDGDWHHYCHTYDGTDWLLYFDGALVHTETVALDTGSDNPLTLGVTYTGGLTGYLDGAIDEVYVYSSALDAASIQALYDAVTAAPTVTPVPTSNFFQATLVAHYSFDDGTAADDGDNSLDGTISGATATTGQYGIGGALSFDGTDDYVEFPRLPRSSRTPFDDGEAEDDYGELDGTIEGATATTGRDGSGALSFDGVDDYVEFPSAVTADILGNSDRTLCLWLQRDTTSWEDGTFFTYGDDGVAYGSFALRSNCCSENVLVERHGNDDNWDLSVSGLDDGGWHHVCMTYEDSVGTKVYFDASLVSTTAMTLDTQSTNGSPDSDGSLDGTINGATATTGRDGSGALSFDGSDDYVEFPSAVTADILGNSARTLCLWALIDDFDGGALFSYDSNADQKRFGFMTESTAGEFRLLGFGEDYDFLDVAASGSDDGDWHHYCHTYDGTDWLLYFDATLVHTETVALDTGSDNPLTLGVRYSAGLSGYFDGSIDEVYVYASALDAASIQVLYDVVTAAPTVTPLPTSNFFQATLVAHYSFDDGTAADDGDNSLDGTISGATATTGQYGIGGALSFDGTDDYATLVAYSFDDGEAEDDYGELDGTIEGATATTGRDGSGALSFDGVDDYVEFPSAVTADILGNSDRTLCLWLQRDTTSWEDGTFFTYGDDGVAYGSFALRSNCCSENVLVERHGNDDNWDLSVSGLDDGGWHHVCMTYEDSVGTKVYFDASLVSTTAMTLDTQSTNAPPVRPLRRRHGRADGDADRDTLGVAERSHAQSVAAAGAAPTSNPSSPSPSAAPTSNPSSSPSAAPSPSPSAAPTSNPSSPSPSAAPTSNPSSPSPSAAPTSNPSSSPSAAPSPSPSASPSAGPSPLPTASFVEIASIGTESTCVSLVECDLLWTYRGDPGACATVSAVVADLEGNVVASDSLDNDGEDVQVVPATRRSTSTR